VLHLLAPVLDVQRPDGGLYLRPNVGTDDAAVCRDLFIDQHVTAVTGSYLSREVDGVNPGAGSIRLALVASLAECIDAAERIRALVSK
ncbi:succinyldiaminopimelate transaminase, partial [Pseudomonas syringae pv. tagetis]